MALPWLRLYSDLLNSRKFHKLPDTLKARLILLWCLAAKYDGILPGVEDIAFSLRLALKDAQQTIDELKAARFLDETASGLIPHDWSEHQHISDISTGRVKLFRERNEKRGKTQNEVKRGGAVSRNGTEPANETPVKLAVAVQEQNRADTEQIIRSAAESAAACEVAEETFDLTDEERAEAWKQANGTPKKTVLTPEAETLFDDVARRIHSRHPAVRRCGITQVKRHLSAIMRRNPPAKRVELLHRIDENHTAWCAWPEWLKEDGKFAKGLENWLAPTKERWSEPPPLARGTGSDPEPPKLMM